MTDEELLALPDGEYEAAWEGIFADISTVYSLRPGHVLTQEDFDAIQRFDQHYRDQEEAGTAIFHRAYQQGLREGGSADIVELKNKIDLQFVELATEKAMRAFAERRNDELRKAVQTLRDGYADAAAGLAYVLQFYGRLSGVGFDRVADAFFESVTMPEREGLLAGSHTLPAFPAASDATPTPRIASSLASDIEASVAGQPIPGDR